MFNDERFQPGAYITNGKTLCEVVHVDDKKGIASIQDCVTETKRVIGFWNIRYEWTLVKPAPGTATVDEELNTLVAS